MNRVKFDFAVKKGSLQSILEVLENMFVDINKTFFDGKLQQPVIAVNSDDTNSAYGWFTTYKAWQEEGTEGYYEINICAESLNRPINETIGTLIHEMVHLHNMQNGIKDTSRGGSYHNKNFKVEAEKRGLSIERDNRYGWTKTSLNSLGENYADKYKDVKFSLFRVPMEKTASTTTKKSSSRKYICPDCGNIVRATKELNILCGECSVEDNLVRMELEE